MNNSETKKLQKLLKLIANENKFRIVMHLAQGEECVCDIGAKLGIEQSLVSHHLNSLRKAKVINDRKIGSWVHCSLNKKEFERLSVLFEKFLSPINISDKMCSVHEECKCLIKGEKMKNKIIIYDPPMCCSSGICGPNPDQTLIDFQDTYAKLKQSGSDIERYIITQSPEKFKENPQIIKLIHEQQLKVLPITTVNDVVVKTGSYPTGIELQSYAEQK